MQLLFAKTVYPTEGQVQKFIAGLNAKYKLRVCNTMPRTLKAAVKAALYMEDLDLGASHGKAIASRKDGRSSSDSDVAEFATEVTRSLTKEFGRMSLAFARNLQDSWHDNDGHQASQAYKHQSGSGSMLHLSYEAGHDLEPNSHLSTHCATRDSHRQDISDDGYGQQYSAARSNYSHHNAEQKAWSTMPYGQIDAHLSDRAAPLLCNSALVNMEAQAYAVPIVRVL